MKNKINRVIKLNELIDDFEKEKKDIYKKLKRRRVQDLIHLDPDGDTYLIRIDDYGVSATKYKQTK